MSYGLERVLEHDGVFRLGPEEAEVPHSGRQRDTEPPPRGVQN